MDVARQPARAAALLLLVSAMLLSAGTAALPLLDRDEPRFAHATVEMIERGDWIVPHFNDEYRFDKPPLTYWLMAAGYGVFGVNEFGARAHSVLASLAMTLVVFLLGRRLMSADLAFAAALAWTTCIQVFLHGRLAVADMPMLLAVALMQWALWELLFEDGGRHWQAVLWIAAVVGFLAKGPIALAVPAVTLVGLRVAGGSVAWRRLSAGWGVPVGLAIVGSWGIPALMRTGGAYWDVGIGEHVVRRGVAAFNDRPVVPGYYLITVLLSLFPWSPHLGQLAGTLRGRWAEPGTRFLLGWLVGPFLIFSFYSTQLPHYTLPAFPALLYLLFRDGIRPRHFRRASRTFYWVLHALVAALLSGTVIYLKWVDVPPQLRDLKIAVAALAGTILALQAMAILLGASFRGGARRVTPVLILVAAATVGTAICATVIRPLSAPVRLLQFHERVTADAPHFASGYAEPSLVFYSNAFWRFNESPDPATVSSPGIFIYRSAEWGLDRLFGPDSGPQRRAATGACGTVASSGVAGNAVSRAVVDARATVAGVPRFIVDSDLDRAVVCGFNFARSSWTELVIFYRGSSRQSPGP